MSNDSDSTYGKISSTVPVDDMPDDFDSVSIRIASATDIKNWAKRTACKLRGTEGAIWPCPERGKCACGEVKTSAILNFPSFRPDPEGLFCESIFGPQRDWRCHCGQYRRLKHAGTVCEECTVEVTHSRVRRGRFGYISLTLPVAHTWFFKAFPSPIAILCGVSLPQLERVLYADAFIVIEVSDPDCSLEPRQVLTNDDYIKQSEKYPGGFRADTCASAIREILRGVDLQAEVDKLKSDLLITSSEQKKRKLNKQMEQLEGFIASKQLPEAMIMDVIPVMPAGLRDIIPLEGGRYATIDLNDLYRRVINRNNRIRKLIALDSPKVIIRNEHRMLQEAADSLFENQAYGKRLTGPGNRRLKSVADIFTGKDGEFRQVLLGKSVNYSGAGPIVVAPELEMHQCGLPKHMAIKLFEPFIVKKLLDHNYAQTVKRAKYIAQHVDADSPVWNVLEEVIRDHPVLLNRLPTLHRLNIQAFMPVLVEGQAIRVSPLAYKTLGSDCDNNKVIVHVPITVEAQIEAKLLMLACHNMRKPINGETIALPQSGIVIGLNFLTKALPTNIADANTLHQAYIDQAFATIYNKSWAARRYTNLHQIMLAYETGKLKLHDSVQIFFPDEEEPILTTVGRVIFNNILPDGLEFMDAHACICVPFFNKEITAQNLGSLVDQCFSELGTRSTVTFLDNLQKLCSEYATRSALHIDIRNHASHHTALNLFDYFTTAANLQNNNVKRIKTIPKAANLNRRLVNVASDVVITEIDCGTHNSIKKLATESANLTFKISGRSVVENCTTPVTQEIIVHAGSVITPQIAERIEAANIPEVRVRSVLTCESRDGICAKCYGIDLTNGKLVSVGEPIGVIAAQSISELNMHPLRIPSHVDETILPDMVAGIPRLIELFETSKRKKAVVPNLYDLLNTGSTLIDGVHIKGEEPGWCYLIDEIQKVYQAGSINEKHIEVIVRQMSQKIRIVDPGDTSFYINQEIHKHLFQKENKKVYQNEGIPAKASLILQGITQATLNTESFLLSAVFKATKRELMQAAIQGKKDTFHGLRENVMAGKLIPVGTGFNAFR